MAILTEFLLDITISSTFHLWGGGRFGRRQETAFRVSAPRGNPPPPPLPVHLTPAASDGDLNFDLDDLTKN